MLLKKLQATAFLFEIVSTRSKISDIGLKKSLGI